MTPTESHRFRTKALNLLRRFWMLPGLERVAAAFVKGTPLGGWRSRILPNHYQYPHPSPRPVTDDAGVRFLADVSTWMGWSLRFGLKDPSIQRLFGLIQPGMTVVDVGANIGVTSLTASALVGSEGHVVALEPHPVNFTALLANLDLNLKLKTNVLALNLGLGRAIGEAHMEEPAARNPAGFRISSTETGARVEIEALDTLVDRHGVLSVDLLKIDTEGFEYEVLLGAAGVLRRSRPIIFIELSEALLQAQGSSTEQVVSLLLDHGYEVHEAVSGAPMDRDADYLGCHCDAIAVPT